MIESGTPAEPDNKAKTDNGNKAGKPASPRRKPSRKLRSGRSIVPRETIAGTTLIFVIAIMTFLACITLGAVSMVNNSAERWRSDISREVTVQIRPTDSVDMESAIRQATQIILGFDGVSRVTVLNPAETARLLEPWLGSGLDLEELPVPRLMTVALTGDTEPDFSAMREKLEAEVPGSSLDDHRAWVERLTTMAMTMVAVGTGIFLLVMAATITTVIFATRGAMAGNRDVVEVLHFVGADSGFISSQFQRHFLLLGLKGAAAGAAGAILLFVILSIWTSASLATPEGDQISALFGTFTLSWGGYAGMVIVLFLVAGLTAFTSRWTVHRQVNTLQNYRK